MEKVRRLIGCDYAYKKRIYGSGVGIAILDSGVAKHIDLPEHISSKSLLEILNLMYTLDELKHLIGHII